MVSKGKDMKRLHSGALLAGTALLTAFTATAAPVVIDTEQKANAAVVTTLNALARPSSDFNFVTFQARGIAESALLQLAAATTPAALMGSPGGLSLACGTSGNLTARMARSYPRVLRLQWQACKFQDIDSYPRERNGSAEILLLSDTFSPTKVGAIRFGNGSTDFTDSRHIEYPDQITDEVRSLNLRMLGKIPMTRAFPSFGLFVGDFAYELTGFYQLHSLTELPGSGLPLQESMSRNSFEFVIATGATTYNDARTQAVEDLRLNWGRVTNTSLLPPPWGEISNSYTVEGLRLRRESDYVTFSDRQSVDGKIDFQYGPPANGEVQGCGNGLYTFKTRTPLGRTSIGAPSFAAGEVLINGTVAAQFYSPANVPATLPVPQFGMLIHLDVRNVGVFNYDSPDLSPIYMNAQCQAG